CVRATDGHECSLRKEQDQAPPEVEVPRKEVEGRQRQKPQQQNRGSEFCGWFQQRRRLLCDRAQAADIVAIFVVLFCPCFARSLKKASPQFSQDNSKNNRTKHHQQQRRIKKEHAD